MKRGEGDHNFNENCQCNVQDFGLTKVLVRYETLHTFGRGVSKRVKTCYVLYGWVPNFKRSYAYNIAQEALVGPPPPDFGPEMIYDVSAER